MFNCYPAGCSRTAKVWYNRCQGVLQMTAKGPQIEKACPVCGKVYMVPIYRANRNQFCSRACLGIENAKRLNESRPSPKTYAHKLRGYQPSGIQSSGWKGGGVDYTCKNCGKVFKFAKWRHKDGLHTGDFCTIKCRGDYRTKNLAGEKSPFWVGGPRTYRGKGWLVARAQVVADQKGICARCNNVVGNSLPIHHIKPFREFKTPTEANVRTNLIGLCQSCHMIEENLFAKLKIS
jgi:hypothetical protein